MATATKTPAQAKNQNGSTPTKPKGIRPAVEIPALTVAKSDVAIAGRSSASNPLAETVKIANENRANTYDVGPTNDNEQIHDKIVRLLQAASRLHGCSIRASKFGQYPGIVKFRAIDKVTRTVKPKDGLASAAELATRV